MAVPPILAIKSTKKIRKIISFTLSNVVQGVIVTVSYQYRNEEVAATHDADEMLDLIKMEKVKFD